MNIVVCVKHVPDTAHLKFDANNQLAKDNLEWGMSPFCEYAAETAVRLRESNENHQLAAFSLGVEQAKDSVKRAIAMGADTGFLINDSALLSADSWSVAYALSAAVKKHSPEAKLALFGQFATDTMAGITGPAFAELMGWPSVTFVKQVEFKDEQTLVVHRETERGLEVYEVTLPAVICIQKCDYEARIPAIKGVMKANRTEIPTLTLADLGLTVDQVASPTQVLETYRKPKKQGGTKVDGADAQAAVNELMAYLKAQKLV